MSPRQYLRRNRSLLRAIVLTALLVGLLAYIEPRLTLIGAPAGALAGALGAGLDRVREKER